MTPIDPSTLPGLPAPFWFIELFKIIGFVLHCIPMSIWFVGLPLAIIFFFIGGRHAKRFATRIFKVLPILMALGINFGIVPLLFVQTAYYKAFYSSTILLAFHWFLIIVFVGMAYYAIYACSFLVSGPRKKLLFCLALFATFALWGVGMIFTSEWTLMESPSQWPALWSKTETAGAVSGFGTYWRDPVVFIRLGSTVGIALLTLAFWTVFDAWFLCRRRSFAPLPVISSSNAAGASDSNSAKMSKKDKKRLKKQGESDEDFEAEYAALEAAEKAERQKKKPAKNESASIDSIDDYRRWAVAMASSLSWIGCLLAAGMLQYYYFRALDKADPNLAWLYTSPWNALMWGTLAACLVHPILLLLGKWQKLNGAFLIILVTLAQLALLAAWATTRQFIQNAHLAPWLDVTKIPDQTDWNPLFCFLGCFAFALLVILWMIRQMVVAGRNTDES